MDAFRGSFGSVSSAAIEQAERNRDQIHVPVVDPVFLHECDDAEDREHKENGHPQELQLHGGPVFDSISIEAR